jgi:hypothetical protein
MQENNRYFVNDIHGESIAMNLVSVNGVMQEKKCIISGRNKGKDITNVSCFATHGFPGIPLEKGIPNPDTFLQGEDAIFDSFLFYEGKEVVPADFNISVVLKASPRAVDKVWTGILENGIFQQQKPGFYTIWIPSLVTSQLLAGTYYMEVILKEGVGRGDGAHDRTISLAQYPFNIDYGVVSDNPETISNQNNKIRGTLEQTWPNSPNTIGN